MALITKLAPVKYASIMMGIYFALQVLVSSCILENGTNAGEYEISWYLFSAQSLDYLLSC